MLSEEISLSLRNGLESLLFDQDPYDMTITFEVFSLFVRHRLCWHTLVVTIQNQGASVFDTDQSVSREAKQPTGQSTYENQTTSW